VKVLDYSGNGTDSTLMAGLEWVLDYHNSYSSIPPAPLTPNIMVVNMSLGRTGSINDNPDLHDLIKSLETAGITVVVSAGNDPNVEIGQQIPAAYPEVFAVASTTALTGSNSNQCRSLKAPAADTASYFTTDGAGVAVSAPGEDHEDVSKVCGLDSIGLPSTRLGGGTTWMSGTSVASAHVAGVVARYYQQNPLNTPASILLALQSGASRRGDVPLDSPHRFYTYDGVREGIAQAP
jgi:serine protease